MSPPSVGTPGAAYVLRDGSSVHVRPLRPDDRDELLRLLCAMSDESRYSRFFGGGTDLVRAAANGADVDFRHRFGLVATAPGQAGFVAHAMFVQTSPGRAEAAFEVRDDFQGRGLGSILLSRLAEYAASVHIDTLEASVLAGNQKMMDVFRDSGRLVFSHADHGVFSIDMTTRMVPGLGAKGPAQPRPTVPLLSGLRTVG
jgi:GNAT superfamily N-acetyltransferase